jgi:hypothetical protein
MRWNRRSTRTEIEIPINFGMPAENSRTGITRRGGANAALSSGVDLSLFQT